MLPPNCDHTASVSYPNHLSQPAKFVQWSLLYRNKRPIDPIFDHIYHCYRPHYPDLPGGVPTLRFQTPRSSNRLRYTGGFDSAIFSRTWRESGLPKVVPLEIPMDLSRVPDSKLITIYKYMTDATKWVDVLLDQAVDSQSKSTSPGFEACLREYNLQPPDAASQLERPIYDRWAARINFLSEPLVRRFVENLIVNMLIRALIKRITENADVEETEQAILEPGDENLPVEKPPKEEVPTEELSKSKNYKKNQKRSRRHRKRRIRNEETVSVSGQAVDAVTSTSQKVTSSRTSAELSLVEALVEAGVEVSALNYLMILVPAGVASSLEEKMPPKAANQATLKTESLTVADDSVKADRTTTVQSDDSTANMAASISRVTSTDSEDAEVILGLTPLNLNIRNNASDIARRADDNLLVSESVMAQTLVDKCIDGSESGKSEDSDSHLVLTFDGRNACEVTDLTIEDHPEVNKFMEIKFSCAYCQKETTESHDSETAFLCPGCGPCSAIRYCSKTCILADAVLHQPICGLQPGDYPVIWDWTPSHMQSKFPYIIPIGHEMSPQCFRQMVYAAALDSDDTVTHPYITYHNHKMPEERRKAVEARMKTPVLTFVSQGDYQIFVTGSNEDTGDTAHDLTIQMPDEMSHQFRRARNSAWLTNDMKLIRFIFHIIKLSVNNYNIDVKEEDWTDFNFVRGFELEFPSFNHLQHKDLVYDTEVNMLDRFEKEWPKIEQLVKDLELKHPILRCWMTDADPEALPFDPATRYTGLQWLRQDPWEEKFVEGDPTREWGIGYNGTMSDVWKFLLPETKDEKAEQAAKEWNTVLHGPKEDGHASWKGFRD